jgi:malate synthase
MQYLAAWLGGSGAVAIDNLMEDAATAEISRAQLWQWIHRGAAMKDGGKVTADLYRRVRDEELVKLRESATADSRLSEAARLMDDLVLQPEFTEFLTLPGYERLA